MLQWEMVEKGMFSAMGEEGFGEDFRSLSSVSKEVSAAYQAGRGKEGKSRWKE